MDDFMGIPYTKPIHWLLNTNGTTPPLFEQSNLRPVLQAEHASWFPFIVSVEVLDTVVDVYQKHVKCCWPRILIEARVAEAHDRLKKAPTPEVCAPLFAASPELLKRRGLLPLPQEGVALACNSQQAAMAHQLGIFLKAVYACQTERPPRSKPNAQRIVFRNQLPSVFRCQENSNDVVYMITGALKLVYKEEPLTSNRNVDSCLKQKNFAEHKREVLRKFPMMMAIAPSSNCAAYVQSERASSASSDNHAPKPQILILKEFRLRSNTNDDNQEGDRGLQRGDGIQEMVWEGIYSSFTWFLNPHGNKRNPLHQRSHRPKKTSSDRKFNPTSTLTHGDPSFTIGLDELTAFPVHLLTAKDTESRLEPLSISFDIFSSCFHDARDKKNALKKLMDLMNVADSKLQKKLSRFAVGLESDASGRTNAAFILHQRGLTHSILQSDTAPYIQRLPSFINFMDSCHINDDTDPGSSEELSSSSRSCSNSSADPLVSFFPGKRLRPPSHQSFSSLNMIEEKVCEEVHRKNRGTGVESEVDKICEPLEHAKDSVGFQTTEGEDFPFIPCSWSSVKPENRAKLVCVGRLAASRAVPREFCRQPNAMLLYNVLPQGVVFPLKIVSLDGNPQELQPLDNALSLANALVGLR
ncbi:unnamed protein product [Phytomonas sp. EM1]|nr:unnamed protein product [Phytomonas sp. EM1]|eukprot:CCW62126.1 unnamed protein product [Phytomonas sp. isolate EM1]